MKPESYIASLPKRTVAKQQVWEPPLWTTANEAVSFPHIQPNGPVNLRWMLFDVDHRDAWLRIEASRLPPPTYIAVNKENRHAHAGYLLEAPVCVTEKAHEKPVNFLHDIERGFRARMGGDPAFSGCLTKNPCHGQWDTDWNAKRPYRLDELNDSLDKTDKAKATASLEHTIIGRNYTVFNAIRKVAYAQVLKYKKDGKSQEEFMAFLLGLAQEVNRSFPVKLGYMELKGIAKSVAKWAWNKYDPVRASAYQSARIAYRWRGHVKPWMPLGLTERTYYRHRKLGLLPPSS